MPCRSRLVAFALPVIMVALPGSAAADSTLNAGARLSYDNNVNGSPTKANRLSDNRLTTSASGVYYTPPG